MKKNKSIPYLPYVRQVILNRDKVPSFKRYPFNLPAFRDFDTLELHPAVTFIIGENGTGKSTLLEAIAVAWGFNPEGGSRNYSFDTRASHSELFDYLTLLKGISRPGDGYFLRAESFFNVATNIDELDKEGVGRRIIDAYGGIPLHEISHGEAFLALLTHRFRGKGFYVLDEPEAALSPQRQLALLHRMHQLVKNHSQFVIATHSPILMAYPDARIIEASSDGLREIAYEDTEHYRVTHDFLNDPERMLALLLNN